MHSGANLHSPVDYIRRYRKQPFHERGFPTGKVYVGYCERREIDRQDMRMVLREEEIDVVVASILDQ